MRSLFAIANVLGSLLMLFAALFLLPIAAALLYGEAALDGFLIGAAATLAVGGAIWLLTRRFRGELKPRDGYLLVTLGCLLLAIPAALRLLIELPQLTFTDAFFETISGLSTTGATVLDDLDRLPHAVNLWRHALQWFGGMGIIVLAVAILPLLGVGGMQMYRAESPGPVKDSKLTPRITQTVRTLWTVYVGLTAACILCLMLAGMSPFDAVCHGFSVLALGGFSTHDASIAYFNSATIEFVMIVFMLIAAVNFATHFVALRKGDLRVYARDSEARWLLVWIACSIVALTLYLRAVGVFADTPDALRQVAFTLVSLASTSGLVAADYGQWPLFAILWMMFLGCVIPSTGSTGGGIKQFRALILLKQARREMFFLVHPQAVAPLKIGGNVVPDRIVYSVLTFVFVYVMTLVSLTFALLASNLDFISAITAVLASLNNTSPLQTYAPLSDYQKWVCAIAMFLGRIELFTCLVLFTPAFWRK